MKEVIKSGGLISHSLHKRIAKSVAFTMAEDIDNRTESVLMFEEISVVYIGHCTKGEADPIHNL